MTVTIPVWVKVSSEPPKWHSVPEYLEKLQYTDSGERVGCPWLLSDMSTPNHPAF